MRIDDLLFKLEVLFLLPFALIIVCVVRLLRPVTVIRFGRLISTRIGHFAADTELYLCERDLGLRDKSGVDIFYHSRPICNKFLAKMWDRVLHTSRYAYVLYKANRWLPGHETHEVTLPSDRDTKDLLSRTRQHLFFTPEEDEKGKAALRMLGIPEGSPFVCLHARDPLYLKATHAKSDFRYHDYRNSSWRNYTGSMEDLAKRGYYALRMGKVVAEPLGATGPRIIDYSMSPLKSDFLDIYLCAKCSFFVGDASGLSSIPMVFRRPSVMVNLIPLEYAPSWHSYPLFIPKKLFSRKTGHFLRFREVLESGAGRFLATDQYEREGIEVAENTAGEISSVAIEMDERLNGKWKEAPGDEELQRSFWSLLKSSELHGTIRSRIGADFLRNNRELLE